MLPRAAFITGLLIVASPLLAAPKSASVKDWAYKLYADGSAIASTENESRSSLGIYCASKGNCWAYLVAGDGCQEGIKVPVLMNAGSGSQSLTTTCKNIASAGEKPFYVNVIDELESVLNTMLNDHTVGFAIPFANGQFKVVRFSLEGANEAIAVVNNSLREPSAKPASNRDQVL